MSRPRFRVEEIDRSYRLRNIRQSAASTLLRVPYGKSFTTVTYSASLASYLDYVGRGSFYGFLASLRGQLFRGRLRRYCPGNGRDSVPPSLVAYDKVSDLEAKQRADFDIRWKVALGIEVEARPFAKSTLQLFRAQLILHDRVRAVFQRSLQFARQTGCLKGRRMKVAVDTTYILGLGAVKDTYNLLADGIVQVVRALAQLDGTRAEEWALRHGLELYFGSSVKGEAGIWDNKKERQALLQKIEPMLTWYWFRPKVDFVSYWRSISQPIL